MNSKQHKRSKKSSSKKNKQGLTREFAAARLGPIKRPTAEYTVEYSAQLQGSVVGTDGYVATVNFNNFTQMPSYVELYQYFEILGYSIDCTLNPNITTYYEGSVAYRPINYLIGEVASSSASGGVASIERLPGAVWLAPGARNDGKWCVPTSKQVFSTRAAITGANPCGNIVFYVDNVGVIERVGDVIVRMNVLFYGTQYTTSI